MIRLLIVLISFMSSLTQCAQDKPKSTERTPGSGPLIDNSPTRGLGFADTLGQDYNLVYITTTVTNDQKIPIHFQMCLPYENDYPKAYGDQKFKLLLWPELTSDQVTSLVSNGNLLDRFSGKDPATPHILNKTLEPNEEFYATIGTLFPRPTVNCSATPYELFEFRDKKNYTSCEWPMNKNRTSNDQIKLGLKVGFCTVGLVYESCRFIPCGQISYSEH